MKENVTVQDLRVCFTVERDTCFIQEGGDQQLLSGISIVLTDEMLLPQIVYCIHIENITSINCYCDISPESLSQNLRIRLNIACDTLQVTTQQGIRQIV